MNCLQRYPILATLLKPFRRSQQKTCADLVAAMCQASQASSFAVAGQLARLTEVHFGSALNRFYRFLRKRRSRQLAVDRADAAPAWSSGEKPAAGVGLDQVARPVLCFDSIGLCRHTRDPGGCVGLRQKPVGTLAEPMGGNLLAAYG